MVEYNQSGLESEESQNMHVHRLPRISSLLLSLFFAYAGNTFVQTRRIEGFYGDVIQGDQAMFAGFVILGFGIYGIFMYLRSTWTSFQNSRLVLLPYLGGYMLCLSLPWLIYIRRTNDVLDTFILIAGCLAALVLGRNLHYEARRRAEGQHPKMPD